MKPEARLKFCFTLAPKLNISAKSVDNTQLIMNTCSSFPNFQLFYFNYANNRNQNCEPECDHVVFVSNWFNIASQNYSIWQVT